MHSANFGTDAELLFDSVDAGFEAGAAEENVIEESRDVVIVAFALRGEGGGDGESSAG